MKEFIETWLPVIIALFGGGTLVGLVAHFVSPASDRLAFRRTDRDAIIGRLERLEKQVAQLTIQNRFLTAGVTALGAHSDELRIRIIVLDPDAKIKTAWQILHELRENIEQLEGTDDTAPVEVPSP